MIYGACIEGSVHILEFHGMNEALQSRNVD